MELEYYFKDGSDGSDGSDGELADCLARQTTVHCAVKFYGVPGRFSIRQLVAHTGFVESVSVQYRDSIRGFHIPFEPCEVTLNFPTDKDFCWSSIKCLDTAEWVVITLHVETEEDFNKLLKHTNVPELAFGSIAIKYKNQYYHLVLRYDGERPEFHEGDTEEVYQASLDLSGERYKNAKECEAVEEIWGYGTVTNDTEM